MREAVLIPALNEGPRIADCLIQVRRYFDGTVLVVDGGSTDNTCTMAKAHGAEVIQQEGQGYANAAVRLPSLTRPQCQRSGSARCGWPTSPLLPFHNSWRH